jgi:hypothetical protein
MVIADSIGDNKFECAFSFEVSHSNFAAAKFQKSVVKMQNYRDENRLTWAIFAWLSAMRCMQTDLVRGGASNGLTTGNKTGQVQAVRMTSASSDPDITKPIAQSVDDLNQ